MRAQPKLIAIIRHLKILEVSMFIIVLYDLFKTLIIEINIKQT